MSESEALVQVITPAGTPPVIMVEPPGARGPAGLSAYELWLAAGNTGTEAEFLLSLKGDRGEAGAQGIPGPAGPASTVPGPTGPAGPQGVKGDPGPAGAASTVPGPAGRDGVDGISITGASAAGGNLTLTRSDGSTLNAGPLPTAASVPWSGVTGKPASYPSTIPEVSGLDAALSGKASTQSVTDLTGRVATLEGRPALDVEAVQDAVAQMLGTVGSYNDAAGTYTITLPTPRTDEEIQDVVAALIQAGANVTRTYDDAGNVLTISATGGSGGSGGLTAVTHDATLTGDGTAGSPLSVVGAGGTSGHGVVAAAMAGSSVNVSATSGVGVTLIWPTPSLDLGGWYSAAQPSRFTVPAGITHVEITGYAGFVGNSSGIRTLGCAKNGQIFPGVSALILSATAFSCGVTLASGLIPVQQGDYFELSVYQNSGGTLDFDHSTPHFFAIKGYAL